MRRASLLLVLVSCGHQVPEPDKATVSRVSTAAKQAASASTPRVVSPSSDSSALASSTAPSPTAPRAADARCVVETPPEPTRPAPPKGPDPRCPADPTGPFNLRHATVRVAGLDATLDVEVAERDEHRMRGLMYRKSMGEARGMLFIFEDERELGFWMRNTCIPLDMIFASSDGTIVGIEENVPTLNDDHYAPGDCPARYVVEVNAGWSRRHGVKAGQKLIFGGL